jgi:hypothetical protein
MPASVQRCSLSRSLVWYGMTLPNASISL